MTPSLRRYLPWWLLLAAVVLTLAVYVPGLSGGWIFDDYPNIVHNEGVQPEEASVSSLVRAALSSPSSLFKRPLASLSFALNYLAGGLDPFGWKLVNLVIHLMNGLLVFVLVRMLVGATRRRVEIPDRRSAPSGMTPPPGHSGAAEGGTRNLDIEARQMDPAPPLRSAQDDEGRRGTAQDDASRGNKSPSFCAEGAAAPGVAEATPHHLEIVAALVAGAWMLLPINLTAVLYVVQRMESLANLFVLAGLAGYVATRARMMRGGAEGWRGPMLCAASLIGGTFLGLLVKETAVLLPLYAFLVEWLVFGFRRLESPSSLRHSGAAEGRTRNLDKRILGLFALILWLPMLLGMFWAIPHVLDPESWATRNFSLTTRLLSEARIVVDYIGWTLLPLPQWLSFYHDGFQISTGLLTPWTTLAAILVLIALVAMVWLLRHRAPLVALGIALFLGCHSLTGTILPLELVFEHRNYFASLGLLLAVVPWLAQPRARLPLAMPRRALLGLLLLWWTAMTAFTAWAWGDPLRLAADLAARGTHSPRAQYELGRTYIIYSDYDPASPFTELVYAPLERAAALPQSSILPEQALIFMNSRMGRPIKDAWWDSMIAKLRAHKTGVQDESSLKALTKCAIQGGCELDQQRMLQAFDAALSHPNPTSRLLAAFSDWLWNIKHNRGLSLEYARRAVAAEPSEPAYRITLAQMYLVLGQTDKGREQIRALEPLNIGGRLDSRIAELRAMLPK